MDWARTLRIDAAADEAMRVRVRALPGVRSTFGPDSEFECTYVLLEGPQDTDPSEFEQIFPQSHLYGEAVIALAIEPEPADALPHLLEALAGHGAPAGIASCRIEGNHLLIELLPSVTHPVLILRVADVELQRFHGYRRTRLLSPLPVDVLARIAAGGLQAPGIAPDRILESLLNVE